MSAAHASRARRLGAPPSRARRLAAAALAACALALGGLPSPAVAATPDELLDAVRKGDLAAVKAALDAGVPVDAPFRYERTALSFATARGQLEIVRLLVERGADPRKKDTFYGASPFDWAVSEGHVEVVRLLIDKGAPAGPDLLLGGARDGNAALVALALEKTKPSADDLAMALADAKEATHAEVVAQLERAGAKPPPPADFPVDAATLSAYAGAYREARGNELRFEVREGRLFCVNCSPGGLALGALDAVTFRGAARPRPKLVFALDAGKPAGFTLDFGDRQVAYERVAEETGKEKP